MGSGKRKLSRKVKRTIRKALSGVCMASALIVALVPARPTQGYVEPTITTTTVSYTYGVEETDKTDLAQLDTNLTGINLAKHLDGSLSDSDKHRTMSVTRLSNGDYEIMWQFEVYTIDGRGIISKYNSLYNTGELEIAASLPLSYLVVEDQFRTDYFDAHTAAMTNGTNTATIQASPNGSTTTTVKSNYRLTEITENYAIGDDQEIVEMYFPSMFAVYKQKYQTWAENKRKYDEYVATYTEWQSKKASFDQYTQEYQDWVDHGSDPATKPTPVADPGAAPTPVEDPGTAPAQDFWVADMDLPEKNKFFCAEHPYFQQQLGGRTAARKYTLTRVVDSRDQAHSPQIFCWMPQGVPNEDVYLGRNDDYGFVGSSWTAILGIGSQAFANTTNVTSLKLAGELKYIGDEAFANSFVESITFANVEDIGNRAYKNCTKLKNISLSDATVNIGTEAFYGCNSLTSVALPQSICYIGPGAFADCTALTTLDLSAINQSNCDIDNFAFYDCIALSNVTFSDKINRIGDGAFACTKGITGSLTNFKFPDHITGSHTCKLHTSATNGIGAFVLAGRTNLKTVTMPADYGRTSPVELSVGTFYGCINLQSVTFPDDGGGSCGYVSYEEVGTGTQTRTIYDTIQNQQFCVYGPAKDSAGKVATPRKSTWGLKSGLGYDIPYIYKDASGEHVEISNGDYIFIIDDKGVLQSCIFSDPQNKPDVIDKMEIPPYVGETKVTGIASGCFASTEGQEVLQRIQKLVFSDNTVSEIADSAFKECALLEEVVIGNSVKKIGPSAFENCPKLAKVSVGSGVTEIGNKAFKGCNKLTYVNFETPAGGYSSFPLSAIGEEAFSTGAESLKFEGDIDMSYGPFLWAMQKDNYVDSTSGVRVCYTTGYPNYLSVIVDNRNGYPTLVDYLHFDQINDYAVANGIVSDPTHTLMERYEKKGQEETDASGNIYTYSTNAAEDKLVEAALNLVVPSGIQSIDAYGYFNNKSPKLEGFPETASNTYNAKMYFQSSPYYSAYRDSNKGGLFSNYYGTVTDADGKMREYPANSESEIESIGNDRLTSVTLNSVKYLPDYTFYSCENLKSVILGSELEEMGIAPFAGCTKLASIGSMTDQFVCENGIVYEKYQDENGQEKYRVVEVLSARGSKENGVGDPIVSATLEDPRLAEVAEILPGAFENCDYITEVNLMGMSKDITKIPDNCFKDCDKLGTIELPDNITEIGHNAFAGVKENVEVIIHGKEVYLPSDAFGTPTDTDDYKFVEDKKVVTYLDTSVYRAARDIGANVSKTLDDIVKVRFFDYNGKQIGHTVYVNKGTSVSLDDVPEDPVRDGYTFLGWEPPLKGKKISEDTIFIATYEIKSTTDPSGNNQGSTSGNDSGNGNGSGNGSSSTSGNNTQFYTLTVTNGNGSGSYAAGATVIITCTNPPSGQVFDKWVPTTDDLGIASVNVAATTLKMPAHEASVTATFKKAPSNSSGSGGGGSTSGNNSGNKNNGTTVFITKPGVSNTSLASAQVSGSSDNYVIRISETAQATAAVEKALTNEYGSLDNVRYSAMDISLYDASGVNRITNYSGLSITITMPIPDVMTQYAGNNKVAGVVNEKLDKLKPKFTSIDGVPCVTFTATHFSPYTIYVNTANLSGEPVTIDGSPKTGDGIHPKWFLVAGLVAISIALFFMKDKKPVPKRSIA